MEFLISNIIIICVLWFESNILMTIIYVMLDDRLDQEDGLFDKLNLLGNIMVIFLFLPLVLLVLLIIGFTKSFKFLFFKRKKNKSKWLTVDEYNQKSMEVK